MSEMRFSKHYTRAEARELLPKVRDWLEELHSLRSKLQKLETSVEELSEDGADTGGETVNAWVRCMADIKSVLVEFFRREIQIKDLARGLIDFPSIMSGKEVFLCWENGEKDIEYWHDLEAGYAGRQPLDED